MFPRYLLATSLPALVAAGGLTVLPTSVALAACAVYSGPEDFDYEVPASTNSEIDLKNCPGVDDTVPNSLLIGEDINIVTVFGDGIQVSSPPFWTPSWSITNWGIIESADAGIYIRTIDQSTIDNSGSIQGDANGIFLYTGGTVNNHASGIVTSVSGSAVGFLTDWSDAQVNNAGHIQGMVHGVTSYYAPLSVDNEGVIEGRNVAGIRPVREGSIINRSNGIITGGNHGVFFENRSNVTNLGGDITNYAGATISGNTGITVEEGALEVINAGLIVGTGGQAVLFADGGDLFELHATGQVLGTVDGQAGDDTFRLGGALDGDFDTDLIGTQYLGFDTFEKSGSSTWALTGNTTTDWSVTEGVLEVNGTLGNLTVQNGLLSGTGTLGATTVGSDGIHAPGNSIGVQTVDGDYVNSGTLRIEATPDAADRVVVTNGDIDITDATLDLALSPSTITDWDTLTGPFIIVENLDGNPIVGQFDPVTDSLAFIDTFLDYQGGAGNDIALLLRRNDASFSAAARSFNQSQVAGAVESLGGTDPLWREIVVMSGDNAREAFDLMSGEVHASAHSALIANSHDVAALANARNGAIGSGNDADAPIMGYAPSPLLDATVGEPIAGLWGTGFGGWGEIEGDGNAGNVAHTSGGFVLGADGQVTNTLQLGFLAGYSRTGFDVPARASRGSSDTYHLGLYGGGEWSGFSLTGGATYSGHGIETTRNVVFGGINDTLEARYRGATTHLFAEAAYALEVGGVVVEPFAGLDHIRIATDPFTETGGMTALSSPGFANETTSATLGVRGATDFAIGEMAGMLTGGVSWQRVFGPRAPSASHSIGGSGLIVDGAPLARDTLALDLRLELKTSENATLGVGYGGQFARGANRHAIDVSLSVAF